MEHLHHFDLRQDPFSIEPDLRIYFDSPSHLDAQRRVERGLRQMKGLTVLTGEGGTGKTLLARRLLNDLEEEVFEASLMVMLPGAAEAGPVLQRFARQLGVEHPGEDRAALMVQIYEMLAAVREEGRHSVLILDDAHLLAAEPMAEIGGLLNLEYEDRRLLSIMLVGLPVLDESLLEAAALEQRVDVRVRLQPLDAQHARLYLEHRLQMAGGRPDILSAEAVTRLAELSGGRPRLMNTLADNGLFEAFLAKHATIGACDIERAAVDLGILAPEMAATPAAPAPAPAPAAEVEAAEPADFELDMGEIDEPEAELPGLDMPEPPLEVPGEESAEFELGLSMSDAVPAPDDSVADLGSLLGDPDVEDDFSTLLIEGAPEVGSATLDLDEEISAVLRADTAVEGLPAMQAENAEAPLMAEARGIAFPDEGPPKDQTADELDDLFVELIEE